MPVRRGRIVAEAQNFSRELKNEPANRLTPLVLAEQAEKMAAEYGLECEILDEAPHAAARHGIAARGGAGKRQPPGSDRASLRPGKCRRRPTIWA